MAVNKMSLGNDKLNFLDRDMHFILFSLGANALL